jgi:hypothetical protein
VRLTSDVSSWDVASAPGEDKGASQFSVVYHRVYVYRPDHLTPMPRSRTTSFALANR